MLRPAFAHSCATAQQPNLVPQKTRLRRNALTLAVGLLARLIVFQINFFSKITAYIAMKSNEIVI